MAKRKKKSQPVVMPKRDTGKMIVKVEDSKIGWGHMAHVSGAGVHNDSRLKRRRTRGALRRNAIADSNG
jgi:hypothetical protein